MVLLMLIGRLEDLTISYSKLFEILLFLISCTGLFVRKTRAFQKFGTKEGLLSLLLRIGIIGSYSCTSNLKVIKWKTEIGSCRSSLWPSCPNLEITGPYHSYLKLFEIMLFLISSTGLNVSKARTFEKFGKM